jgi:hypothetical protein
MARPILRLARGRLDYERRTRVKMGAAQETTGAPRARQVIHSREVWLET